MVKSKRVLICFIIVFLFQNCATYYQKNLTFRKEFSSGDIQKAYNILDKNKKVAKKKNQLLYYMQKGLVLQLLQQYDESNENFEEAYFFIEDYKKNFSNEALSILTNSSIKPYVGEDFEVVLIHYYKAMNFLMLNKYEKALVECRRMDNKINELNVRYEGKKYRYKKDAFILNLMGVIYDASGDYNNAFIAYRNAYFAYEEIYKVNFSVSTPSQLKNDLLRAAYLVGFSDELNKFEKLFNRKYIHNINEGGELVFFWHNGLGPVKDEWSMNFVMVKGSGGALLFENKELGLNFPFMLPSSHGSGSLFGDFKVIRTAFPRYRERKPYYRNAVLNINNTKIKLEVVENINNIAFATLQDRMFREFGTGLLRLALKQSAEYKLRQENENLGALFSIVNAVMEKADTRNWQTLPYEIAYARIKLPIGKSQLELKCFTFKGENAENQKFDFDISKGDMRFKLFHSLESNGIDYKW